MPPVQPLPLPPPTPPPSDSAEKAAPPTIPPPPFNWQAAGLSFLIPGLGQVYQGRTAKGLLFFFGLYTLFFYGMWMGQWKNVWLPDATHLPANPIGRWEPGGAAKAIAYRPQFLGQFFIGVAAWPAAVQYANYDPTKDEGPVFGSYQRAPTEDELNDLQRDSSKRWDLGWVYTVIAGVLNLLVIYDALAGPMFREPPPGWKDERDEPEGVA